MKKMKQITPMNKFGSLLLGLLLLLQGCASFKAERVSRDESDAKAMEITNEWVGKDTELVVADILKQIQAHQGFQKYLKTKKGPPKLFISEVQNATSEAYFPISDMNDELLNEFSASGEFVLIDAAARDKILKEIQYQNDGMVDPSEVKDIGKQSGADLLIFGNVNMKPQTRDGKTIKEYTVNIRMTDLEKGIEVLRTRAKVNKFSEQSKAGW